MIEIATLIVRQMVKRARADAARKAALAASGGNPALPQVPAMLRQPPSPVPQPLLVSPTATPAVTQAPAPAFATSDDDDVFGGASNYGVGLVSAQPTATTVPLLSAFGGGTPFLTAFVLTEALAAPAALREPRTW